MFPMWIENIDRVPPEWGVVHFSNVRRVLLTAMINGALNSSIERTGGFPFSAHVLQIAEDLRLHKHRPDVSVACVARMGVPNGRIRCRFF
jgi:hypothetical protein